MSGRAVPGSPGEVTRLRSVTLVMALGALGAPAVVLLAAPGPLTHAPEALWIGILALVSAAEVVQLEVIGYRTPALEPELSPERAAEQSRQRFLSLGTLRGGIALAPAVTGMALAFAADEGGLWLAGAGALVSLALLGWHGLPTERVLRRTERALEARGAESHLRAALGLPARSAGPGTDAW